MKKVLSLTLVILIVAMLAACSPGESSSPESTTGSASLGGNVTEVTLLLHASLQSDRTIAQIPDFEADNTDIKVKTVLQASSEVASNVAIELASGSVTFDLVNISAEHPPSFVAAGYLENLEPYIEASTVLSKDDFLPTFVSNCADVQGDGIWWGLPWRSDIRCLFYNTDYFEEAGLEKPPTTWDEMLSYAESLNTAEHYGAAFPMAGEWIVFSFNDYMSACGYRLLGEDGNPDFNHPETVAYIDAMKTLMKYSPSGIQSYNHDDAVTAFIQGKAAMHFNFVYAFSEAQDASKSQIVGKVGSAPNPKIATNCTVVGGWGLYIPTASEKKAEAFRLAEFILSPETEKKVVMNGGDTCPVLKATFADPEIVTAYPILQTIYDASADSKHVYIQPNIPGYAEMLSILSDHFHRAINDELSAQDAFDQAEAQIQAIVDANKAG